MKKALFLMSALIAVWLFSGCHGGPNYIVPKPADPTAQLSLVYACFPTLSYNSTMLVFDTSHILFDAQNDGSILAATSGVPAGSNVNLTFRIGNGTASSILYSSNFNLATNGNYSMFFGGEAANPCHVFVQNDMTAPATGMAKVRFVNLSSDSIIFNCLKGGSTLASVLSFQSVSPFIEVQADSLANFTFADASGINFPISTGTFNLGSGSIYTIVLSGNYAIAPFAHPTKIINLNPKVTL